jgi:hypothetical protein
MVDECIVAVYRVLDHAQNGIRTLTDTGFPADRISLVATGLKEHPEIIKELQLSDDALHDAAITAGLGGAVGMLAGLGVMIVSGLGAVFLVGPVGGAIVGGITGGFVGAMAGTGVHEEKIRHYERTLERGNVLLIVNGNPLELARAYYALEKTSTVELHTYARSDDEASGVT